MARQKWDVSVIVDRISNQFDERVNNLENGQSIGCEIELKIKDRLAISNGKSPHDDSIMYDLLRALTILNNPKYEMTENTVLSVICKTIMKRMSRKSTMNIQTLFRQRLGMVWIANIVCVWIITYELQFIIGNVLTRVSIHSGGCIFTFYLVLRLHPHIFTHDKYTVSLINKVRHGYTLFHPQINENV